MDFLPQGGIFAMLGSASIVVKVVLCLLAGMSLWSWTIIFWKLISLGKARSLVLKGNQIMEDADSLSSGLTAINKTKSSPLNRIGSAAVKEYRILEKSAVSPSHKRRLIKDTLRRILRQRVSSEMKRLSTSLSFLATCANGAPFIGLFGTVWGIMNSFHAIGTAKSAALSAVAPGISEALVATAIGLVVAIPATISYNFFLGVLGGIETEMVNFAGVFLNRVEREVSWVEPASKHGSDSEDDSSAEV
ncbi:MotA/TolQ/ExbB proton channel family protein [Maridesulfovibrio ferrireducens]|uniref:MotA/TolQ/ExbB proton channel family protein n=1 Tax=Maridesulfovibrio ferrireducens TaxID=246191 RepID=UPI001A35632E|nr:MotA/TolQ/ExbB proton channel family protein [Maridesulfovibrio ferrireducens]MBI9110527.1 MotA/TolQ/ExbB proton channel family protein [Maridesulfovibrio ferrireducens]